MSQIDKANETPSNSLKYKPTKVGKIALIIAITSLIASLVTVILSILSIITGLFLLISCIITYPIAMIATLVLIRDIAKFNKVNNIKANSESKFVTGLIVGIIIGFMWGKIF